MKLQPPPAGFTHKECTRRLDSVSDALYAIGGKWKLKIVISLTEGNKRFNEIQRSVTGISARVLSTELKEMELNGFVTRTVIPNTPVIVEYNLTPYSDTLAPIIHSLSEWGISHREKIMADSRIASGN